MLTLREARQRLTIADMRLSRVGCTSEFRVAYAEETWRDAEKSAYYTDDIEDAMLTGLKMRRDRGCIAA